MEVNTVHNFSFGLNLGSKKLSEGLNSLSQIDFALWAQVCAESERNSRPLTEKDLGVKVLESSNGSNNNSPQATRVANRAIQETTHKTTYVIQQPNKKTV